MSHVTDIILVTFLDDEGTGLTDLNTFLQKRSKPLTRVDDHTETPRVLQCNVFIGAYNWLNIPDLLTVFSTCQWEYPECVQLMLKDENDNTFIIATPENPTPPRCDN